MTKRNKHSTINVTGPDGVTHSGQGDGLAAAVRQLGEQHARLTAELQGIAGTPGTTFEDARRVCRQLTVLDAEETHWSLTERGASFLAGVATREFLDDPTAERAATMERRYLLAEALGYWEGQR